MSNCDNTNPCNTDPCEQYEDCGCLNPTTTGCVTQETAIECLDIEAGEDLASGLTKIGDKICALEEDKGKVLINGDDTCPEYLFDKLAEGTNISFQISGTGCDRVLTIHAVEGGVPVDVNVSVTENDTTTGYLDEKIETGTYLTKQILNPAGDEQLEIDLVPATLISADAGNQLVLGTDGALKTLYVAPDGSETKLIEGVGVEISGTGTLADPYILSTNPSIQVSRPCFDGVWRTITLVATGNPNVVYASGTPEYRYRFDGTLEFRGAITFTVAFGAYSTANRKYTVTIGNIPTTCLTLGEQAGVMDLKSINYIDIPQAGADQYTQLYGYVIRKSAQNILLEFQSSFIGSTSKSIVVNFEGAVQHPLI